MPLLGLWWRGHADAGFPGHIREDAGPRKKLDAKGWKIGTPTRQVTICTGCVEPRTGGDHFSTLTRQSAVVIAPWCKKRLPWLPNKSSNPLDAGQKPYYCGSKNKRRSRLATATLLSLAPV